MSDTETDERERQTRTRRIGARLGPRPTGAEGSHTLALTAITGCAGENRHAEYALGVHGIELGTATRRADKLTHAVPAKAFRGELVPTEAELARREGRSYEPASVLLERIKAERDEVPKKSKHKRWEVTRRQPATRAAKG